MHNSEYQQAWREKRREKGLCSRCGLTNDRDAFHCSRCAAIMGASSRRYNLRRYGLDQQSFEALLQSQGDACALCRHPFDDSRGPICVDHDRATGRVRGLLDRMCNQGIGLLGDDAVGLALALEYLS